MRFLLAFLIEEAVERVPLLGAVVRGRKGPRGPERLRRMLERLGGAFIKFGQLFSMRSDILPPAYCAALANLFEDVPPFPAAHARAIVAHELGKPIEELFSSFDDVPVGAASFGQVHLVTLKGGEDDGRRAAVKVCRPGSEKTIEDDGRMLLLLGHIVDAMSVLGHVKLAPVFRDFVRWTRREVDYLKEAKNADHLHEVTAWNPRQRVPYIYWERTTRRVLTMEYLEGLSVNEIIQRFEAGDPALDEELAAMDCDRAIIARNVWQSFLLHAFVAHTFHGDPHPGNLIVLPENVIGIIDTGLLGRLNEEGRREQGLMLDAVARENIERLFVATLDVLDAPRGLLVTDTFEDFYEQADGWLDACDNPGAPMSEKTINRIVSSAMLIARRVGLVLSPNTMMYYKALLTVDSVVLRLCPEFDYKKETRRAMRLIRMRELDRLYTADNVLDQALLTNLLLSSLPDFVAHRLQDFEQGQKLIYRKLNLIPVVAAGLCAALAWASLLAAVVLGAHRMGYLARVLAHEALARLQGPLDLLGPYAPVFLGVAMAMAWLSRSLKARSFIKVQKED